MWIIVNWNNTCLIFAILSRYDDSLSKQQERVQLLGNPVQSGALSCTEKQSHTLKEIIDSDFSSDVACVCGVLLPKKCAAAGENQVTGLSFLFYVLVMHDVWRLWSAGSLCWWKKNSKPVDIFSTIKHNKVHLQISRYFLNSILETSTYGQHFI